MKYVLTLIAFVAIVFLVNKFNRQQIKKSTDKAMDQSNFSQLAETFSLKYWQNKESDQHDNLMDIEEKMSGLYRNVPMEIHIATKVTQLQPNLAYKYAYSYSNHRSITFTIDNPQKLHFHILPKSKHLKSKDIGLEKFDQKLAFSGDQVLPTYFLEYCADLGWMDLKLQEDKLIFNDTFYDQYSSGGFKGLKMLNLTHPIWKSSANHPQIDPGSVKKFVDLLIDFIEEKHLTTS